MLRMDLQFFASKKGVGSSKNGRDSIAKRAPKNCGAQWVAEVGLFAELLELS